MTFAADIPCDCLLMRFPKARFGHDATCSVTTTLYLERFGPTPERPVARPPVPIAAAASSDRASA